MNTPNQNQSSKAPTPKSGGTRAPTSPLLLIIEKKLSLLDDKIAQSQPIPFELPGWVKWAIVTVGVLAFVGIIISVIALFYPSTAILPAPVTTTVTETGAANETPEPDSPESASAQPVLLVDSFPYVVTAAGQEIALTVRLVNAQSGDAEITIQQGQELVEPISEQPMLVSLKENEPQSVTFIARDPLQSGRLDVLIKYDNIVQQATVQFLSQAASDRDVSNQDQDQDLIPDSIEAVLGTSSTPDDANGDGVFDGQDTDGDGVSDFVELYQLRTDPTKSNLYTVNPQEFAKVGRLVFRDVREGAMTDIAEFNKDLVKNDQRLIFFAFEQPAMYQAVGLPYIFDRVMLDVNVNGLSDILTNTIMITPTWQISTTQLLTETVPNIPVFSTKKGLPIYKDQYFIGQDQHYVLLGYLVSQLLTPLDTSKSPPDQPLLPFLEWWIAPPRK